MSLPLRERNRKHCSQTNSIDPKLLSSLLLAAHGSCDDSNSGKLEAFDDSTEDEDTRKIRDEERASVR